jgi:hypothetical protein
MLCVRLGTLHALVPLITIVGFFTVITFSVFCFHDLLGSLFPLSVSLFSLSCWYPACTASLSCSFLIYTILTFDQKKKKRALSKERALSSSERD